MGGNGGIDVAQGRDRWRAVVNTVMNLRVYNMLGISCVSEKLFASQEGLCFVSK
jgi:hypothetical protein